MKKIRTLLIILTLISLLAITFLTFDIISKTSGTPIPNKNLNTLTGNFLIDTNSFQNINDTLTGTITLTQKDSPKYGFLVLTLNNEPLEVKTFKMSEISNQIILEDILNYTLTKEGTYEIFFSDLDTNVKEKFLVR